MSNSLPGQPPPPPNFRAMSAEQYAALDAQTKHTMVKARHKEIIRVCEPIIEQRLRVDLANPVLDGEGKEVKLDMGDMVVVMLDRNDPIVDDHIRRRYIEQGIEIGVEVAQRAALADGLSQFAVPTGERPYFEASKALRQPPPPGSMYFAVFSAGMATIQVATFHPGEPEAPAEATESTGDVNP